MHLGLDLRGLNYPPLTGVNTYTLHALYQLYQLKQNRKLTLRITAIGLKNHRYQQLSQDFPWLINLIDQHISLSEYLNLGQLSDQYFSKILNLYLTLSLSLYGLLGRRPRLPNPRQITHIFLPQAKPLLLLQHTKTFIVMHDVYGILDPSTLPFVERIRENPMVLKFMLDQADKLLANSYSTAKDITRLWPDLHSKIRLVYPALPIWSTLSPKLSTHPRQSPPTPDPRQTHPYFLAISGIEPRKNWHNLLLAHHLACKHFSDYRHHLVLCGHPVQKGYYQYLRKLQKRLSIPKVHWHLQIDQNQKQLLLAQATALIYPSLYEGFGFPILEAFAHNKPVITSRLSSMPEIAKDAACYVNPLNPTEIAQAMYILSTDQDFLNLLTQQIPKQNFDWTELGHTLEQLLQE